MDLIARLTALVDAAPPDATVTVGWLAELLAADTVAPTTQPTALDSAAVDLTIAQVAAHFGKGTSTIRTWIGRGELDGAYRFHGHEWRVPLASVVTLQRTQARQHTQRATAVAKPRQTANLGEWRSHTRAAS